MKHIALIAEDPSFGASANLVNALRQVGHKVTAIFKNKDPKGFWQTVDIDWLGKPIELGTTGSFGFPELNPLTVKTIFVGSMSWDIGKDIRRSNTTVILTDTYYIRNHERLNAEFEAAGVTVFAMPDLFQYRKGLPTLPYYPPFSLENVKVKKNNHFTICHSPGPKAATNKKGTLDIRKAVEIFCKKYPETEYIEITGKSHAECLELKAKAHVFIDQMVPEGSMPNGYKGGLGKSGVEAMHLGCLVFSKADRLKEAEIPHPHFISISENDLIGYLKTWYELFKSTGGCEIEIASDWAKKYTSYEFVANHVLQTQKTEN